MKRKKGSGRRIAVYVPLEREDVVKQVEQMVESHRVLGLRTSFSGELLRLLALGVQASTSLS